MVRTKTPGMRAYSYARRSRDDAPSAITQSIVRSIARSIHQQKVNTQKRAMGPTPRRRRRRRRVSRDACESTARHHSARACLFALERRRHGCMHPSARVIMHHHSINHHERRRRCLQRDACDGIEPLMSPALAFFFFADRRVRVVPGRVGLVPRHTRTRSFRARDRDWTGQRRRTATPCAIDDAIDARDVVVGVGVDSARATVVESSSSVRRRRGFHSRVRSVSRQIHRRR